MSTTIKAIALIFLAVILLNGCVSQIVSVEEYRRDWVGQPVAELKIIIDRPTSHASRMGWKESTYKLADGNRVYVTPERTDCYIHWEINQQGIIVNSRTEGKRCY